MKKVIQDKLTKLEKKHDIKILYACESGSRAWGFPSPDSDYDVRFIYTRKFEDYLTIEPKKDHLSFPVNDELDVYGWDLSKVLSLITRSNTTPSEWLQSPVRYQENALFKRELWQLSQDYFCSRSNVYHYLGVAKRAIETIDEEDVKIKKLFYIIRPLLAALWCTERNTIAPMSIFPLMDLLSLDLNKKILSLIELKFTVKESYTIKIDCELKQWIDNTFNYCLGASTRMERKNFDIEKADHFFRKAIQ